MTPASEAPRPRIQIRPEQRQLLIDGEPAVLGARAFDLLHSLAERSDRVVGKHELMDLVWPTVVVEENNLQVQISTLRKLLGPGAIATVPGRGYRFTATLDSSAEAPASRPAPPPRTPVLRLPADAGALIGRDTHLRTLASLLGDARLVTLVGTGGIGKTRLAQACAASLREQHADGVWQVELAALPRASAADAIAVAVARALDLRFEAGQANADAVAAVLRTQRLLLLLDNCEHVLEGVASLCATLLRAAPGVKLLATSQEPLNLAEEQVYRLPLLALPGDGELAQAAAFGAVALFVARARAADPRFVLDDNNRGTVVDICRHLDGLPLAIELAAARVPLLGVEGVRTRLDERLRLLVGGRRDVAARQQTLRASLEWSQSLLDAAEQAVFRRLGVFVRGFTVELAQHVAADDAPGATGPPQVSLTPPGQLIDRWAVLDHLASLVDKSLVVADASDPPRYSLLESAREFALAQLALAGETQATLAAHAAAMRAAVARVEALYFETNDYGPAQSKLVFELDNLRAALAWARAGGHDETAVALLGMSCRLWNRCGLAGTASALFAELASKVDERVPPALAAVFWLGMVIVAPESPPPLVIEAADRCVTLWRGLGDTRRLAYALGWRAIVNCQRERLDAARTDLAEAETLEQDSWPMLVRVRRLVALCSLHTRAAEPERARALRQQALALVRASGDHPNIQFNIRKLADADLAAGDFDALMRSSEALIEDAREHGPLWAARLGQGYRAVALIAAGRYREAAAAAREGLPAWRAAGWTGWLLDHLAWLAAAGGQHREAAQLLGFCDLLYERAGRERRAAEQRAVAAALAALRRSGASEGELEQWRKAGRVLDEDHALAAVLDGGTAAR